MRKRFPFLLLAFHGGENSLDMLGDKETFTDEIVKNLSTDDFSGTFIHFSSCYYLDDDKAKELLYKTGALSVSGYRDEEGVPWYPPVALELLFLTKLFDFGFPSVSTEMRTFLAKNCAENTAIATLGEELSFQLWYCIDNAKTKTDRLPNIHPVLLKDLREEYED